MALSITHQKVTAKPDGADASLIQPSDWNDTHTLAGLGAGVETFLETPSSANLAAAVTGETGSGALVFGTTPTLTTPVLANPSFSGTTANMGTVTTIDINGGTIDGAAINSTTIGATTPSTGAFTTLSTTGNVTLGDATTDTVTVNGYMGVGGAPASTVGINVVSAALTGNTQYGVAATPVGTGTTQINGLAAAAGTANSVFTVVNASGIRLINLAKGAASTITNYHGAYIEDLTQGTNNYGITSLVSSGSNKWNIYASGTAANYFAGTIASLGSYNSTTATAANMTIDSSGNIQRSTSSIRYKHQVETLQSQYADSVIFGARPVWYRSKCASDNAGWGWYGLIAEELAEIDPRLVHWGYPLKTVVEQEAQEASDALLDEDGNVLEPAKEARDTIYMQVPDTDAPMIPEGVQYDRLTVMLIDVVQRQQKQIADLGARLAALEAA